MKNLHELQTIAHILGGVPILGVLPGSPAEDAGLRYGDIVTSVNGSQTATFDAFLSAHDASSGALELEVFRDGQLLTFQMTLPPPRQPDSIDEDAATSMTLRLRYGAPLPAHKPS